MAESKFLRWQDTNRDGLIDICETGIKSKELPDCPECKPNSTYISPDWKLKTETEPWYDEKRMLYFITIVTPESSLISGAGDDIIEALFEKYEDMAVENLLLGFEKVLSESTKKTVKETIEHRSYYLDPRPGSRALFLYGVACENFIGIPAAGEDDDEAAPSTEDSGGGVVTYDGSEIFSKVMMFRKAMHLYNRYHRVYKAINKGSLVQDDGKVYTPNQMEKYGDRGRGPSTMRSLIYDLDNWLNQKGMNLPGFGSLKGAFGDRVEKIEFTFDKKYRLQKIKVWTGNCGSKAFVFAKKKLRALKKTESWKDPRACAYFAQLDKMETDLTAREPKPWIQFVEEYTYPKVTATTDYGFEETTTSCVSEKLKEEAKSLGQDILDDVFSIGDAVATAFNKSLCYPDLAKADWAREQMGIDYFDVDWEDTEAFNEALKKGMTAKNIYGMAMEQAFKEMEDDDVLFLDFCKALIKGFSAGGVRNAGQEAIFALFGELDRIKLCGFKGMGLEAIKCLMNGLTLEQALAKIIQSALKSLSIQNFGDLFVGLPPDKQQELDALAKKKFKEGDIFKEGSSLQQTSDFIERPWNSADGKDMTIQEMIAESEGSAAPTPSSTTSEPAKRTLAKQLDPRAPRRALNSTRIFEAYIKALIEIYADDLLSLLDKLNDFPGVPLLAKTLGLFDCPVAPVIQPSFLDFINSIEIPFCTDLDELSLPQLNNPFEWIPKLKDIARILFQALLIAIQKIVISIIVKVLVKICELLGNAICKAIAAAGQLVASLPDLMSGRDTVSNIIKETICGEDADQQQVDDTIADMFAKFGVGGAAFSNQEDVIAFMGDLSAAVTRAELVAAFQGTMSQEMMIIANNLIEFEYPQFRAGLSNKDAIGDLFADCGNLMPTNVMDTLGDFADQLDEDDFMPANPSLCATPEQLEDFCNLRAEMLSGRATSEQSRQMCDDLQGEFADALEEVADIINYSEGPLMLPPIVSSPGAGDDCPPGQAPLIPFESDEAKKAAASALGGGSSQLEVAYTKDLLGNGPGDRNWGLLNMILSDTMGQPITAHWRKSNMRNAYVDFTTNTAEPSDGFGVDFFALFTDPAPTVRQYGAYPNKVAAYLQDTMADLPIAFEINNDYQSETKGRPISFEDLGIRRGRTSDPDLTSLAGFGYNVDYIVDGAEQTVTIITKGRKKTPDITLSFKDNNKGQKDDDPDALGGGVWFLYGFNIEMYLGDMAAADGTISNIGIPTAPVDATRIKIVDRFNLLEKPDNAMADLMTEEEKEALEGSLSLEKGEHKVLESAAYEFLSVDDIFGMDRELDLLVRQHPNFIKSFREFLPESPLVYLLTDIVNKNNSVGIGTAEAVTVINSTMELFFDTLKGQIVANEKAWKYGAQFDDLGAESFDYVIGEAGSDLEPPVPGDTPYHDVQIGGKRITNGDAIMGMSRDQWDKRSTPDDIRVFYLHPITYGGLYVFPPIYIKPVKSEGWLGMATALFPEFSPCKPRSADIINFKEIDEATEKSYNNMAEDSRLKSDPDCLRELPYDRILERASKAGIEGLIKSACRIYASVHFIKSLATFTTYYPKFPDNYSNIYAQYIVADMEVSFKDSQGAFWEAFNPFKDNHFWYAFLEQAVQTYGRLVDSGQIIDPPKSVLRALFRLNDAQEKFKYPFREDLRDAKKVKEIRLLRTLKRYRSEQNLEAVMATEEDAKLILKEFVREELNIIGQRFGDNLATIGMSPTHGDVVGRGFLKSFAGGASTVSTAPILKEEIQGLPSSADNQYSGGDELVLPDGSSYVGFYHVFLDEETNEPKYMAGAYHTEDEEHDELTVMANRIIVPVGDIDDIGENSSSAGLPFIIQKYTSINGTKYSPSVARGTIIANDPAANLSDIYPGTMELLLDPATGAPVGVTGELGVRHGLEFSLNVGGSKKLLTTVEIDALDVKISNYTPLAGNSKLLLCLINHLKEDLVYKLCTQYIFPINKVLAMLAIYNDMGLFPSIGELTVPDGDTRPGNIGDQPDFASKPGAKVQFDEESGSVLYVDSESDDYRDGWASYADRNRGISPFVKTWDEWDRVVLRNSKSRIKKLFKTFYNSRDFDPAGDNNEFSLGRIATRNLRDSFRRPSSARLPWFKKMMLRPNVFNANGEMCEENE